MKISALFRTLLPIVLVFAVAFAAVPSAALAAEASGSVSAYQVASGSCGENLTWALTNDGVLSVQGTGDMTDYSGPGLGDAPWSKYSEKITKIIIGEGVSSIGDYAFYQSTQLLTVSMADSVASIGEAAFYHCPQLSEVDFSENLTRIEKRAFYACGFAALTLPVGITSVEDRTFAGCSNLHTLYLPDSLIAIRASAFDNCALLAQVYLPQSVIFVGAEAFAGCKKLVRVYFGGTVEQWYQMAVAADNDYFRNARITFQYQSPSDTPSADVAAELQFYTVTPYTALTFGERVDIYAELFVNGHRTAPGGEYSVTSSTPNVIDYDTTASGWTFTLEGRYNSIIQTAFRIWGTPASATVPFYTWNGVHAFRCGYAWTPTVASGTVSVGNYACSDDGSGSHTLSFDAFNTAYSYGAAAVYDEAGALLSVQPVPAKVNRYGLDQTVDGVRYLSLNVNALTQNAESWFTADSVANRTAIQLSNLAEQYRAVVTADGSTSPYPALFTGIDIFTRALLADAGIETTGDARQAAALALIDAALDVLTPDEAAETGTKLHEALANGNTTSNICDIIYEMYHSIGMPYTAIAAEALNRSGIAEVQLAQKWELSDADFARLIAQTPEITWPAMDYAFNLNRSGTEIQVADHDTVHTLENNTIQVSGDCITAETVLDAARPVSGDSLPDALTAGLTDCIVYELHLIRNGLEFVPDEAFELPRRPVTVRLPLTGGDAHYMVYRIEADGTRSFVQSKTENGQLVFETGRLGTFVVGQQAASPSAVPAAIAALAVFAAGIALAVFLRRRKASASS